jgi:hypothetical protein
MIVNIESWVPKPASAFELEISESEMISSVKAKLETRTGVPVDQIELYLKSWSYFLDDKRRVSDYDKIKEGSTLKMLYK